MTFSTMRARPSPTLYEKYPEHPGLLALSNLLPPSSAEILEAMDPESMLANLDEVFPGGLLERTRLRERNIRH